MKKTDCNYSLIIVDFMKNNIHNYIDNKFIIISLYLIIINKKIYFNINLWNYI